MLPIPNNKMLTKFCAMHNIYIDTVTDYYDYAAAAAAAAATDE